jgi:hypothetical protein
MSRNDGKAAERGFYSHWERIGHIERLRDRQDLVGLNRGARLADFKKPADFLVSSPNNPLHYAEVKSTKDPARFPFSNIKEGQHKAAMLEASRGAGSYVFYIWSYAHSEWYVMTARQYKTAIDAGQRSIPFSELDLWQK